MIAIIRNKMIKKKLLCLSVLICLGCLYPADAVAAPHLNSQYYCVVDRETGQPLLGKNSDVRRPMASTTKIMTAILAVEYAGLDEMAEVSKYADRTPEYTIGLRAGQQLQVGELLKVALIRSSNDAAVVLAEHVAGNEQFFAYLMSKKACVIGAMHTRFQNSSGLPDEAHFSTALDLAQISRYALSKPYIAQIVGTSETDFKHPGYQQPLTIRNTNAGLLNGYSGADGVKTGTANEAGKCLIASATRQDRSLIAVVLKSSDRQGDCIKLLDYGFLNTTRQKIIDHETAFKSLKVNNGEEAWAQIVPAQDLWLWVGEKTANIEKIVRLNYNLDAPLKKRQTIGEIDIYIDGGYVNSVALVSQRDIKRQSWFGQRIIKHLMESGARNRSNLIE